MRLLESTKSKKTEDESSENVPHLQYNEAVLVHCNVVNNDYQQNARVLYTFAPNKSFGQLLGISPKNVLVLKTLVQSFHILKFTDQNSKKLRS